MEASNRRRVVITGLGVVAPNGIGKEAFWQATLAGHSGIKQLSDNFRQGWVAGVISDFVTEEHIERKLANRTDRMTHFALVAIQEALQDAQLLLEQEDPRRVGAVIANAMGGVGFVLKQIQTFYTKGPRFVSAYTAIAWLNVANVGQTAIRYNIQGYCKTPVNDSVSGLDAMGMAYTAIQRGVADVILTGGCEACLHPFFLQVLSYQDRSTSDNDLQVYRPFDVRAKGLLLAEGAGICILEEYEHARQRNAPIYGEIIGYGQTNDASMLQPPAADGRQYARAIRLAMQEGQLQPENIAYFNLDGRALPSADQGEVTALRLNTIAHVPVSVPRTTIGHSYAAAGAIDTITALLALKYGTIPPTINCEQLDPRYELDMVRDRARAIQQQASKYSGYGEDQAVLVGGRGLGGANVVLALKKVR
jgi:3-oxoacyl-(acyl-carrier-protein) synthase